MSLSHARVLFWLSALLLTGIAATLAISGGGIRNGATTAASGAPSSMPPRIASEAAISIPAILEPATAGNAVADPATLRNTALGRVEGFTGTDGSHTWLGLPYAQAPVGELRWRAPRPATAWSGTLSALRPPPPCSQPARNTAAIVGAEDCLYLNIHAPAGAAATQSARLPVMVWIHGGANLRGSGGDYDGSILAASQNVVVVTLNYRLGILGWFSHPALRAQAVTPEDASGNYGTLDQILALRWVREHIVHFGGDPDRVTVFGESAGGQNIFALMTAPAAADLFQRAIIQSGATQTVSIAAAEHAMDAAEPGLPLSSEQVLRELLHRHDAGEPHRSATPTDPAAVAGFLRSRSVAELQAAIAAIGARHSHTQTLPSLPILIRDGSVIPGDGIAAALADGRYHRVPVMLGSTRDEFTVLLPMFAGPGRPVELGPHTASLKVPDHDRYHRVADYLARLMKAEMVDKPARHLHATRSHPVFVYRFDWDRLAPADWLDGIRLGATHGLDVPFVFGHRRLGPEYVQLPLIEPSSEADFDQLSAAMMSYWAQFAATGDPATGRRQNLPRWQSWQESEGTPERFMVLDAPERGGLRMSDATLTQAGILDTLAQQMRKLNPRQGCTLLADLSVMSRPMGLQLDLGHPSCARSDP